MPTGKSAKGLDRSRYRLPPDNYHRPDGELLADLRRAARRAGTRRLTTKLYREHGRFHPCTVISRFGGWSEGVHRAGLRCRHYRHDDEAMFLNIRVLWHWLGRAPVRDDLSRPPSRISTSPYQRRFGTFRNALHEFVKWVRSPAARRAIRRAARRSGSRGRAARLSSAPDHRSAGAWPRRCRTRRVPVSRRYAVLKRDRFRCRACGRSPATDPSVELQVDHIRPIARGGSDALRNLQTLCKQCN